MKIMSIVVIALVTAVSNICSFLYIKHKKTHLNISEEAVWTNTIAASFADKKSAKNLTIIILTLISIVVGVVIYDHTTSPLSFYKIVLLLSITSSIAITDVALRIIPNVFTLALVGGGIVFHLLDILIVNAGNKERITQILFFNLIAAVIVVLFLCIISAITRSGMGFGDIKYLGALCFSGGITLLIISTMVSLLFSLVYGMCTVLIKKKKMKDVIPFGPFILLGVLTCLFTGLM